jgi:hypothetical protein
MVQTSVIFIAASVALFAAGPSVALPMGNSVLPREETESLQARFFGLIAAAVRIGTSVGARAGARAGAKAGKHAIKHHDHHNNNGKGRGRCVVSCQSYIVHSPRFGSWLSRFRFRRPRDVEEYTLELAARDAPGEEVEVYG